MTNTNKESQRSLSDPSVSDEDNSEVNETVLLELVSQDKYVLSYTFFIIPELPSFELTGELIDKLPIWLNEICVSNGWKLDFATVDPKYLQWAVTVSTSVRATQIILQVRTRLTKLILDSINETMNLKDSTDLWAPGYLLLYDLHQHPIEIIEQYIRLIRDQQKKFSL
jgi:hypothetical protein